MNYQQGKDVMLSAAVTSETPTNWGLLRVKGDGSLSPLPLFDGAIVDVTCDESHHDGDTSHVRHHAQFIVRSEGVYVSDLDSGQGTWVDGIAVRKLGLAHGSVLRCGRCIALFVERDLAQSASPPKRKGNVVIGVRLQACLDTALGFIHGKRSFLVEGNAGVGKSTMVDAALRKAGETTPVCHLDGACFESEALVRAFERTSPCVWVVRHFEQFPRAAQADLVRTVRMMDGSFLIGTVVGSVEHAHAEGRVCSSCMTLMGSHVIRVPSLIERREDIPMLTMEYLRRTEVPMTFDVMGLFECVLRAGWTGGIRELQDHLS
ncbi:MAG TPA: FHA domain-containing protein, partial [Polyangiaceae bacterium]|nr:FHA domain-containing protein [Polyangiaceae bacterium]